MSSYEPSPLSPSPARKGKAAAPRWFGDLGLVDFQIEFFDRILARSPNDTAILRALGELLAMKGQYARSLQIDQRLVALAPKDCVARYNLACSLAMQGAPTEALAELTQALQYGYDDFGHLEIDPDLDSLRKLPAYQDLLRHYGVSG